jgi:hypothetical protein
VGASFGYAEILFRLHRFQGQIYLCSKIIAGELHLVFDEGKLNLGCFINLAYIKVIMEL